MREQNIYKKNKEKGAITLYVLLACLFFVFILTGVYVSTLNKRQTQEQQVKQIQDNYKRQLGKVDEIYNELINSSKIIATLSQTPSNDTWTREVELIGNANVQNGNSKIVAYAFTKGDENTSSISWTNISATTATTQTMKVTENGTYYFFVLNDDSKLTKSSEVSINNIDTVKPIISTATPSIDTIKISATDNLSGITGYAVTTTNTPPTNFTKVNSTKNFTVTVPNLINKTTYYVWVQDAAGNVSDSKVATITVDLTLRAETSYASSSKFLNGPITRGNIESVKIATSKEGHSVTDSNCWDVSAASNKQVLAWYTDSDNDGYYEVTIGANNGKVIANTNSRYLFSYIGYNGNDTTCIYNLENLDTSNATSMNYMFYYCGYKEMKNLNLGNLDTGNVTNMNNMFNSCGYTALTSLTLGSDFDTSKVTDMGNMFYNCGYNQMTSINLGTKFNTQNVTNMSYMFGACGYKKLTGLDLGSSFNTAKVTNMSYMFYNCGYTSMKTLNLGNNFNTQSVTNMSGMFYNCGYTALTSLTLGSNFDTSKVTNMSYMFYNCGYTSMKTLNLGNNFNTQNVTNMSYMFWNCGYKELASFDLGDKFVITKVEDMKYAFCSLGYTKMTRWDLSSISFPDPQGKNISTVEGEKFYRLFDFSAELNKASCKVYVKDTASWNFVRYCHIWLSDANIIIGSM